MRVHSRLAADHAINLGREGQQHCHCDCDRWQHKKNHVEKQLRVQWLSAAELEPLKLQWWTGID
jgi:hypothetical protein